MLLLGLHMLLKSLGVLQIVEDLGAHRNGLVVLVHIVFGTASSEDRSYIWYLGEKLQNWDQLKQFSICAIVIPT